MSCVNYMNEQYILTDFVVASHLRRFHALRYLSRHNGGFTTDIAKAIWRGSSDEQDSLEELERKIGFFLTDLQERGLIESEMRVMESDFQIFQFSIPHSISYDIAPPTKRAGRYYMITTEGRLIYDFMNVYLNYRKVVEHAKGN